jgi:hypothetical protein
LQYMLLVHKIISIQGNLFTFMTIFGFCPDSPKIQLWTALCK